MTQTRACTRAAICSYTTRASLTPSGWNTFIKWTWTEKRGKVTVGVPLMPMWQCSYEFSENTASTSSTSVICEEKSSITNTILSNGNNYCLQIKQNKKTILVNVPIKESKKDNYEYFFFDRFHPPYTIFIKVHLSAISLPRKQLSVKNSACFWFCFVSGLVFVSQ